MKIKKWIRGENEYKTTEKVIERAGVALDDACASDIVGECLFQAEDGKYYVGTVDFVIQEANPKYVKNALEEMEIVNNIH